MTYAHRVSVVVFCVLMLGGASAVMAADATRGPENDYTRLHSEEVQLALF